MLKQLEVEGALNKQRGGVGAHGDRVGLRRGADQAGHRRAARRAEGDGGLRRRASCLMECLRRARRPAGRAVRPLRGLHRAAVRRPAAARARARGGRVRPRPAGHVRAAQALDGARGADVKKDAPARAGPRALVRERPGVGRRVVAEREAGRLRRRAGRRAGRRWSSNWPTGADLGDGRAVAAPSGAGPATWPSALAAALELPFRPVVDKRSDTPPQTRDGEQRPAGRQRRRRLRGDARRDVARRPVLLVDDVRDSGWTLTEVTKLLRDAGAGPSTRSCSRSPEPRAGLCAVSENTSDVEFGFTTGLPATLSAHGPIGHLRHHKRRAEPRGQAAAAVHGGDLARARVLDLRRRAPARRGPDAGRLRDGGIAVLPVPRDDRLRDRPPAGVPRGRARARARDRRRRGPPAAGRGHALPALRLRHREDLPALPELPAPAQGAVQHLRPPARPALEDLPVLRGGGRPAGRALPPAAAPARRAASSPSAARPSTRRRQAAPPRRQHPADPSFSAAPGSGPAAAAARRGDPGLAGAHAGRAAENPTPFGGTRWNAR